MDNCPEQLIYHSNKAAVYFEIKNFHECINSCNDAIRCTEGRNYDYLKLSKAISRKANALMQLNRYDEAIE